MPLVLDGTTGFSGGGGVATSTALGSSALFTNSTGTNNVGLGYQALYSNTTASYNTAVGYQAGYANSTGTQNTAMGFSTLRSCTTAQNNAAFGDQALQASTTASYNTAVGSLAGYNVTTGTYNVAIGYASLNQNTTATRNVAVGAQALYTNSTGEYNTAIGMNAMQLTTTGGTNTCIGYNSGNAITTGSKNVVIGSYNGNQGSLDIRTASNYIVLSDGDGNPRAWIGAGNNNDLFRVGTTDTSTSSFMHQIAYSQTSRAVLGVTNLVSGGNPSGISIAYPNSGDTSGSNTYLSCSNNAGTRALIKNDGGISNYSANNVNLSDRREKKNFAPSKSYLDTVCAIPVQNFNYIDQDLENDSGLTLGVVAQYVQAVAPELITESNWGTQDEPKMRLSIYQTDLQYALMKSIQELKTIVDAQSALITEQAAEIVALKAKVGL